MKTHPVVGTPWVSLFIRVVAVMSQGSFSEQSLKQYEELIGEIASVSFSELNSGVYDYTRCVRADGTAYGSRGKCRKGREAAAAVVTSQAPRKSAAGRRAAAAEKLETSAKVKAPVPAPVATPEVRTVKKSKATPLTAEEKVEKKWLAQKDKLDATGTGARVAKDKAMRITARIKSLPVKDLEKILKDPRLNDKQRLVIEGLIGKEISKQPPLTSPRVKDRELDETEKKWLGQKNKIDEIKAKHANLIDEMERGGVRYYPVTSAAGMLFRMSKSRGITTPLELEDMEKELWKNEPSNLKKERIKKEQGETLTKGERKEQLRREIESLKNKDYLKTLVEVSNHVDTMKRSIKEVPSWDTPKNRIALTALRALRAKLAKDLKVWNEGSEERLEGWLKESPQYHKTPGANKPAKIGSIQKGSTNLERIYEVQGFNSKPELVRNRSELEKRKDVYKEPDGKPLILYRGVTEEVYARQFQGSGPEGGKHFPGIGAEGNGSYAASIPGSTKSPKNRDLEKDAQQIALYYTQKSKQEKGSPNKVTAFALRGDSNIVQFKGPNFNKRHELYSKWVRDITNAAEERFGFAFNDQGEAAAAMGIHAYRVPSSEKEDVWVILNRGAVIAAQDSQLPDL